MLEIAKYCLPDIKLLEENSKRFLLWIPDKNYIVLGASNQAEESLFIENVKKDNIIVLKRPSGGQAVMLTPNNLIISVVFDNNKTLQPKDVFLKVNIQILSVLEETGLKNLSFMGISDIAISGKKILGSSIYRNKDKLLYQAVLNIGEPALTFERYLKHPVKEPDYRNKRKHIDFITSLKDNGYSSSNMELATDLSHLFSQKFSSNPLMPRNNFNHIYTN
jgi:lipoate---protein ligase